MFCVEDTEAGGVFRVYDVRSDDYGNIEFLVFWPESGEWGYIDASGCQPVM